MLILGLDFETTGFLPECRITEVGAALWDWELGFPVDLFNSLVWDDDYPNPIDPEVVKINGITADLCRKYGSPSRYCYAMLNDMLLKCDYVMAYNGTSFDQPLLALEEGRQLLNGMDPTPVRPWIDSQDDVPFPDEMKTRRLKHLAAEHGFLNPFAHRAVFDVLTMLKIASQYKLADILALQAQPMVQLEAHTSFQTKDLAKNVGYLWYPTRKLWLKTLKSGKVEHEMQVAKDIGFRCTLRTGPLVERE